MYSFRPLRINKTIFYIDHWYYVPCAVLVNLMLLLSPSCALPVVAQVSSTFSEDMLSANKQPESDTPYVLGAGDQVEIEVFRIPEYSGKYEVLVSGTLSLPMVGQISVAGLTIEQAKATISRAYAKRLRRPIINMGLISPRPLKVGIAGEVSHPGAYTIQREGTQFPSLVAALETAGGVTQSADLRQVVITRAIEGGGKQTFTTDLWKFLQTGDLQHNLSLRDGDTIFVPTRDEYRPEESLPLAAASFAADDSRPLNIAVTGEVFRPGPYTVTGTAQTGAAGMTGGSGGSTVPPTVTRAIQLAGGIKPEANIREIVVYRRTRSGQEQQIKVNLWKLLTEGNITQDIVLQEGDTVSIPKANQIMPGEFSELAAASFSPDTIRINVVGEVERPGVVQVAPNTLLNQGILAAGGFDTRRARKTKVELIRPNPDGSVTRKSIPVDFAAGMDENTNPLLRNNDVIIVNRSASAGFSDALQTVVGPFGGILNLLTLPLNFWRRF